MKESIPYMRKAPERVSEGFPRMHPPVTTYRSLRYAPVNRVRPSYRPRCLTGHRSSEEPLFCVGFRGCDSALGNADRSKNGGLTKGDLRHQGTTGRLLGSDRSAAGEYFSKRGIEPVTTRQAPTHSLYFLSKALTTTSPNVAGCDGGCR